PAARPCHHRHAARRSQRPRLLQLPRSRLDLTPRRFSQDIKKPPWPREVKNWWWKLESNQRTLAREDLQSPSFGHLDIPPNRRDKKALTSGEFKSQFGYFPFQGTLLLT